MGQEGQPECRMHQQRIQGMLHGIAASQFVTGNVPKSVPEPSTQLTALKGSRDVSYKVEHLPSKHGILNSNSGTWKKEKQRKRKIHNWQGLMQNKATGALIHPAGEFGCELRIPIIPALGGLSQKDWDEASLRYYMVLTGFTSMESCLCLTQCTRNNSSWLSLLDGTWLKWFKKKWEHCHKRLMTKVTLSIREGDGVPTHGKGT
jgi:hypothetical protein